MNFCVAFVLRVISKEPRAHGAVSHSGKQVVASELEKRIAELEVELPFGINVCVLLHEVVLDRGRLATQLPISLQRLVPFTTVHSREEHGEVFAGRNQREM